MLNPWSKVVEGKLLPQSDAEYLVTYEFIPAIGEAQYWVEKNTGRNHVSEISGAYSQFHYRPALSHEGKAVYYKRIPKPRMPIKRVIRDKVRLALKTVGINLAALRAFYAEREFICGFDECEISLSRWAKAVRDFKTIRKTVGYRYGVYF